MVTRSLLLVALFIIAMAGQAFAQLRPINPSEGKEGEITRQPICSVLINRSDQTIIGTLSTAPQTVASGDSIRHRDNFRLEAGERKEFCTTGPFYQGRRLEIVLRTLIPLFDCKTKIDHDIYLDVKEEAGGFRKLYATCD